MDNPTVEQRRAAILALKAETPPDIERIAEYLTDLDESIRSEAADALGELGDPVAGKYLVPVLKDRSSFVRGCAADAVGVLRFQPAVDSLLELCRTDRSWMVRLCAAESLGDIGIVSPAVVQALTHLVQSDPIGLTRAYSAESLGILGVREAVPILRKRLAREHKLRIRASMLAALAMLGDAKALKELLLLVLRSRRGLGFSIATSWMKDLVTEKNISQILHTYWKKSKMDPSAYPIYLGLKNTFEERGFSVSHPHN